MDYCFGSRFPSVKILESSSSQPGVRCISMCTWPHDSPGATSGQLKTKVEAEGRPSKAAEPCPRLWWNSTSLVQSSAASQQVTDLRAGCMATAATHWTLFPQVCPLHCQPHLLQLPPHEHPSPATSADPIGTSATHTSPKNRWGAEAGRIIEASWGNLTSQEQIRDSESAGLLCSRSKIEKQKETDLAEGKRAQRYRGEKMHGHLGDASSW
ncbi:hypothetical protein U0070_010309 [Myodes glareolus]|uniref:Uncharacterized protein n=1 Tax=Myodes glareolus TaxID=447135 RepID=A0AAW0HX80_MYOGA